MTVRLLRTFVRFSRAINHMACREEPKIMKLDWATNERVLRLRSMFESRGHEIRLAGGPVRDLLMGIEPKDLDFATVATPAQMKAMFEEEGVRTINANGEKHGTVTVRMDDADNYEITTLRIDVATDGRHAEVLFTEDWKLDANRRDLTINSMYLGFDGTVYDYFYGHDDLKARRIAFVGDADTRIKEDYLRIMRYFRFYGRISESADNHEMETLLCIKENAKGLERISGERIWTELKKTLSGNFACDLLKTMLHLGLGNYLGLPENSNITELDRVCGTKYGKSLHPITMLASLLRDVNDVIALNNRLKFSTYDRDLAYFIIEYRNLKSPEKPLLLYQKILLHTKAKPQAIREYIVELLKYQGDEDLLELFNKWEMPKFHHISVAMLNKNGALIPKYYATIIKELKTIWAENDFNMSIEEVEKLIPDIASKYSHSGNVRNNVKI